MSLHTKPFNIRADDAVPDFRLFLKSDDVAFSFTIFEGLHQELLGYLTSVLYHVITLAEQSPAQTGGTQEISPDHVHQALSLRGETHPGITLAKYLHRISEEIDDSGMSTTKRSHLEQYVDPPGKVSWWQMPLAGACPFPGEEDMLAEDDGDSTTSEDSSEEEDDQLDEAIDELDMAYDALLETALWDAVERDQPMKMDDMDDPWEAGPAGSSSGTVEMEKAKNARMAYERIRKDTSKARRQRHIAKHRSTKFPTTRLRKLSRRERKIRSAAVVVDSSDEEVREGEGSGESEEGGGTEASDEEDEEEEEDWSAHDTSEEEEVDGYERGLER